MPTDQLDEFELAMARAQRANARDRASNSARFLFDAARRELEQGSSIDPAVIAERGYESIHRPTSGDQRQRERLHRLGIPSWATKEDTYFPGLLIPVFGPTGQRVTYNWKPRTPVPNRDGKTMKYASPKGQTSRVDVHPQNRDKIVDPAEELWATEGIKKADSLTSRGVCTIALAGVFNWRSQLGTLGDWEDVLLNGRVFTVCFDADARDNPNVLRAMIRFGRWLKSKGVKKVYYLIVPAEVHSTAAKGVDDFLAAGGTLEQLKAARTTTEPNPDIAGDTYTDARLAETIADDVLADRFIWVSGLGWLSWDGRRWAETTDAQATEAVREYALHRFAEVVDAHRNGQAPTEAVDGWRSMLSAGRMRSVLTLARGIVERETDELDADPDLLNTPTGVVDLRTGELLPHDPTLLITKITSGGYRPGYTHPDWVLRFPYTFRKPGEALESDSDRQGDPALKGRIRRGANGQHDAIVTWATQGAIRWHTDPGTSLAPTSTIKGDTRTWRAEADRILGFWDEQLTADRDASILTTEMREAFNTWLKSNGHNVWAKELFGPRFEQHAETVRHGIEVKQPSQLRGLSRFESRTTEPPARSRVYQGVRFQTASDKAERENGTSGTTPSETASHVRDSWSFPKGRSGRSETHSTCTKCGKQMRIIKAGQTTHPACEGPTT